jgi:hypothetical protein
MYKQLTEKDTAMSIQEQIKKIITEAFATNTIEQLIDKAFKGNADQDEDSVEDILAWFDEFEESPEEILKALQLSI